MSEKYLVDFDIYSKTLTLDELSVILEEWPDRSSHSLGQLKIDNSKWKHTIWRREIGEYDDSSISNGWLKFKKLISRKFHLLKNNNIDMEGALVIGILTDNITAGINIPSFIVNECSKLNLDIYVSVYLTD